MQKLYILTCTDYPNLHPDDKHLLAALKDLGILGLPTIWDTFTPPPEATILIRTPWDYPLKPQKFKEFLKEIEEAQCKLLNPLETVFWNLDKRYMVDLQELKVPGVPTEVLESFNLTQFAKQPPKAYPFVLKPRLGASGRDTFLIRDSHDLQKCKNLEGQDTLLQPYIPSIQTEGEYSFIFFDGVFSHAVVKNAQDGEFRVQGEHGGSVSAFQPNKQMIAQAAASLKKIGRPTVYARVDLVHHENQLLIMELELIEPELFLRFSEKGSQKLASAILNFMNSTLTS